MGILLSGAIARRIAQIQIQGKKRSNQIVAKVLCLFSPFRGHPAFFEQLQKSLLRIQPRGNKVSCPKYIARIGLHSGGSSVLNPNLSRNGSKLDFSTSFLNSRN